MTTGRRRPFEVDRSQYPFADHWLERGPAALHYLDEGHGTPVLLLHGNPTWSFLYRDVIGDLRGSCRLIAPDYPGFGLSEPPPGYGYTPPEHARWVEALIDRLGLGRFVLVAHDWGGPIGLSLAVGHPERVAGLVLCNTWCWPADLRLRLFSAAMGGRWPGRYLQLRRNFFARRLVPLGIARPERRTGAILSAYTAPFPTPASRMGTWVLARAIRSCGDWLRRTEAELPRLRGRPVELVWGMSDPAFGRESSLARWQAHFPGAAPDRLGDASHLVPEDHPERVAAAIRRVLARP